MQLVHVIYLLLFLSIVLGRSHTEENVENESTESPTNIEIDNVTLSMIAQMLNETGDNYFSSTDIKDRFVADLKQLVGLLVGEDRTKTESKTKDQINQNDHIEQKDIEQNRINKNDVSTTTRPGHYTSASQDASTDPRINPNKRRSILHTIRDKGYQDSVSANKYFNRLFKGTNNTQTILTENQVGPHQISKPDPKTCTVSELFCSEIQSDLEFLSGIFRKIGIKQFFSILVDKISWISSKALNSSKLLLLKPYLQYSYKNVIYSFSLEEPSSKKSLISSIGNAINLVWTILSQFGRRNSVITNDILSYPSYTQYSVTEDDLTSLASVSILDFFNMSLPSPFAKTTGYQNSLFHLMTTHPLFVDLYTGPPPPNLNYDEIGKILREKARNVRTPSTYQEDYDDRDGSHVRKASSKTLDKSDESVTDFIDKNWRDDREEQEDQEEAIIEL